METISVNQMPFLFLLLRMIMSPILHYVKKQAKKYCNQHNKPLERYIGVLFCCCQVSNKVLNILNIKNGRHYLLEVTPEYNEF